MSNLPASHLHARAAPGPGAPSSAARVSFPRREPRTISPPLRATKIRVSQSPQWGFYHIPLNMPEEERFLYWDKLGRSDDSAAIYEYLTGGLARVIDSWWISDVRSEN